MIAGMKDEKIKSLLKASKSAGPLKVGFLLIPDFSMFGLCFSDRTVACGQPNGG